MVGVSPTFSVIISKPNSVRNIIRLLIVIGLLSNRMIFSFGWLRIQLTAMVIMRSLKLVKVLLITPSPSDMRDAPRPAS